VWGTYYEEIPGPRGDCLPHLLGGADDFDLELDGAFVLYTAIGAPERARRLQADWT
jgi:hypothetical protein